MSRSRPLPAPAAATILAAGLLAGALAGPAPGQFYSTLGEFGSGIVTAGDQTGLSVAILGDVNGDGTDDLVIGAPFDDDNGTDSGTVYVVNGYAQTILYEKHGTSAGDRFGTSVANIGDMNGDGKDDVLVGAPGTDFNGNDTGSITVYSGADGLIQYSALGPKAGSRFGAAVAGGGDLNGDGRGDFIVGAPDWYTTSLGEAKGWAAVYSGNAGNQVKAFNGTSLTATLGAAVAFVGDLDGDGRVDYAAGSPGYDYVQGAQTVFNAGLFTVYSGLDHSTMFVERGGFGDLLGSSLARAGDSDADGVPELIVGAPGYAASAGTAWLYEGTGGTPTHQYFGHGFTPADAFGAAVGPLGDVNHDGFDDVLVGAPLASFSVGLGGYIQVFSGATHAAYGGPLSSPNGGDGLGRALSASAGDLSGDDWNDVLVGWPFNDFAGSDCGVAKAYALTHVQPNLNFGGPGFSGLVMYGTQLFPGGVADLALTLSKPNSPAFLVASPVELLGPFKGGTLVPSATPGLILPFVTDAQGRVKLTDIPGGGGPLIVFMQFLVQDAAQPKGWQLSNAIAAEFLP